MREYPSVQRKLDGTPARADSRILCTAAKISHTVYERRLVGNLIRFPVAVIQVCATAIRFRVAALLLPVVAGVAVRSDWPFS